MPNHRKAGRKQGFRLKIESIETRFKERTGELEVRGITSEEIIRSLAHVKLDCAQSQEECIYNKVHSRKQLTRGATLLIERGLTGHDK
jgi:hypothetical protein